VQSGRAGAVSELAAKAIGKKLSEFKSVSTENEEVTHEDLGGKVTVLHFWEYRDEPLKEPYGQVGYLDFLYHQRQRAGLNVYGVAVDGRLADEATIPAARRSARKLREFMNLSYPVLLDRGDLLKQLGDPRILGASLPLFVVIGADGAISHFHVGMYEVTREQGLKELDEAVTAALNQK
jgi:alkyl hydroperoxide reductase subunit AhpC